MNKNILALVFGGLAAVLALSQALGTGLTPAVLVAAVAAGVVTGLSKIMDPNSAISLPPVATAIIMALAAVAPQITNAINAGTAGQLAVWIGIIGTFITTAWAKWSNPNNLSLAAWRRI